MGYVMKNSMKSQQGTVLVISLMILIILSIVSVSAGTNSIYGERMTSNQIERSIAFQAAQFAVSQGERWLSSQGAKRPVASLTRSGNSQIWVYEDKDSDWWLKESQNWWLDNTSLAAGYTSVYDQPRYFVEEDPNVYTIDMAVGQGYSVNKDERKLFRITAMGESNGTGKALVQVHYAIYAY